MLPALVLFSSVFIVLLFFIEKKKSAEGPAVFSVKNSPKLPKLRMKVAVNYAYRSVHEGQGKKKRQGQTGREDRYVLGALQPIKRAMTALAFVAVVQFKPFTYYCCLSD